MISGTDPARIDAFLCERLAPSDAALDDALRSAAEAGMPAINVAPNQGKLLMIAAMAISARRVLEVGTLAGYSTLWLARGLAPGGRVVTLELEARHAAVARGVFERAGLRGVIDLRQGPALESLRAMPGVEAPFDLVFIDADKALALEYFDLAVRLSRPGALVIVDNAVRGGSVADPPTGDASAAGMRRLLDALAGDPRVAATALQTVGSKGHDGFVAAVVLPAAGAR